MGFVNSQLS